MARKPGKQDQAPKDREKADPAQPLANQRHERFAQGLAKGLTAIKAYEEAGFSPDRGAATRLSAKVSIKDRVRYIVGEIVERSISHEAVTLDTLTAELEDARRTGLIFGQVGAAVQAIKTKAELHGFLKKDSEGAGAMADLLKGATIINGQHVLTRIEIVVVDPAPAKPAAAVHHSGAGGAGVPAVASARQVQGR